MGKWPAAICIVGARARLDVQVPFQLLWLLGQIALVMPICQVLFRRRKEDDVQTEVMHETIVGS